MAIFASIDPRFARGSAIPEFVTYIATAAAKLALLPGAVRRCVLYFIRNVTMNCSELLPVKTGSLPTSQREWKRGRRITPTVSRTPSLGNALKYKGKALQTGRGRFDRCACFAADYLPAALAFERR